MAEISYLGSTISSSGTSPNREKVEQFLSKIKMPKNHKQIKRMIGFFQCFRNYLPKLSDSLLPFFCHSVRCQLLPLGMVNDRRLHHESTRRYGQIICPSGVWVEDLQPDLLEAVNLCEGISGGAFRIRYFRPYLMGSETASSCAYRESKPNTIFSDQD